MAKAKSRPKTAVPFDILFLDGKPVCKCCGAAFRDRGPVPSPNFEDVGAEVAGKTPKPRFVHTGIANARQNCPSFLRENPAYAILKGHSFDFRVQKSNRDHITSPQSTIVLKKLMLALTQKKLSPDEIRNIQEAAMPRLKNMELLHAHPWVAPYLIAYMQPMYRRNSAKGDELKFCFFQTAEQTIAFDGAPMRSRSEKIPAVLSLVFQGKSRGFIPVRNPNSGQESAFPVSKSAFDQIVAEERLRMSRERGRLDYQTKEND